MKIGVDLDGVVVDLMTPFLEFHNRNYGTFFSYRDITSHNFWIPWGLEKEEANRRLFEFMENSSFYDIKPQRGAISSVKKLSQNHRLDVITSRPEFYKEKTIQWLDYYLPKVFREVIFTYQYPLVDGISRKGEICMAKGIEIMIEDIDRNALACVQFCEKVLLFDQPWNQDAKLSDNIVRVKNWKEVLREIDGK